MDHEPHTEDHPSRYQQMSCLPRLNKQEYFVVPAGLPDDDPLAKPERSIFWDDHASWYSSVDAIPKLAEGPGSLVRENEK